jgi:hypothetical protein
MAQVVRSGGERRRHLVWGQREATGSFPYLCVCGRVDDAAAKLAEEATVRRGAELLQVPAENDD